MNLPRQAGHLHCVAPILSRGMPDFHQSISLFLWFLKSFGRPIPWGCGNLKDPKNSMQGHFFPKEFHDMPRWFFISLVYQQFREPACLVRRNTFFENEIARWFESLLGQFRSHTHTYKPADLVIEEFLPCF